MRTAVRAGMAGLITVLMATAACVAWSVDALRRPHAGWNGDHVDVELPAGLSAGEMLARLGDSGVLRHPLLVRRWLSLRGGGADLHAGEYRFDGPASPLEVLERLRQGDVLLHGVTVPEGLTLAEIAFRLAEAGVADEPGLLAAFRDPAAVADLDPAAADLEGYLFPETYHFPRAVSPGVVAAAMVGRFREAAGPDYAERASAVGFDLREAVTLASMIERETAVPGERDRISRVFHNRLRRRMRLQCDPTVIYALRREGREVGRLTYADLEFESPWNTYHAYGLPPGPIANPGRASLDAAVAPGTGDELYFVAAPDGGHRFSTTLEGHLEAVAAWRAYSRSSR